MSLCFYTCESAGEFLCERLVNSECCVVINMIKVERGKLMLCVWSCSNV